jgi:TPR repeat protein
MRRSTSVLLSLCILSFVGACASGGYEPDEPESVDLITGDDVYAEARRREANEGASDVVIEQYTWAFENGSVPAAKRLAEIWLHGYGGRSVDHVAAVQWLERAADGGDVESRYNLGCMYSFGYGVEQDSASAAEHWRIAAEQGFAPARENLGTLYFVGSGVAEDPVEAARWFRLAAESGSAEGQYKLALMLRSGLGIAADPAEALRWMHAAAAQEHFNAICDMGAFAEQGIGMEADPLAAAYWYWKSAQKGADVGQDAFERLDGQLRAEAEGGEPRGMRWLGLALRDGLGVEVDAGASFAWFERAAQLDDPSATFELARCYAEGLGVEVDGQRAFDTCVAAARLGHAAANYEVALMIESIDGHGSEPHERALAWMRRAAELGHAAAQIHVELEPMFARALAGDREDQRGAGLAYAEGRLQRRDYEAARHWLELAHAQGDQTASLALGKLLLEGGESVTLIRTTTYPPDHLGAVSALESIASYGNTEARTLLATTYADSASPVHDLAAAIEWANLAAANGDFTSVPIVQSEVDRAARAESYASLATPSGSYDSGDSGDVDASDPMPLPPCGFCGGAGVVVAERGHYVGSHYWPDTYATCTECNGTGLLYH